MRGGRGHKIAPAMTEKLLRDRGDPSEMECSRHPGRVVEEPKSSKIPVAVMVIVPLHLFDASSLYVPSIINASAAVIVRPVPKLKVGGSIVPLCIGRH